MGRHGRVLVAAKHRDREERKGAKCQVSRGSCIADNIQVNLYVRSGFGGLRSIHMRPNRSILERERVGGLGRLGDAAGWSPQRM